MEHALAMELIPIYALGALGDLEAAELRALEEHVRGCTECTAALNEHARTSALLGLAVQPVEPPARVKSALMKRLKLPEDETALPNSVDEAKPANAWFSGRTAAAAALVLGVAGILFYQLVQIRSDLDGLKRVSMARDVNLRKIRERLERRDRFILALYSRDARVASVSGKQVAAKANGSFVYLPHRRSAQFFISGLDKPPPGKSYQLWIIADNRPLDGGLIAPENDGVTMAEVAVPDKGKVNAFAVSLEPQGGVPVRTGPIIILAPIAKGK